MIKIIEFVVYSFFISIVGLVFIRRYGKLYSIPELNKKTLYLLIYIALLVGTAVSFSPNQYILQIIIVSGMTPIIYIRYLFLKNVKLSEENEKALNESMNLSGIWLKILIILLIVLYLLVNWNQGWQWPLAFLAAMIILMIYLHFFRKG